MPAENHRVNRNLKTSYAGKAAQFSDLSERLRRSSVPIPIPADTRDNEVNHALGEAKRREAEQAASWWRLHQGLPSSLYYEEPLGQPPSSLQKLQAESSEGTQYS